MKQAGANLPGCFCIVQQQARRKAEYRTLQLVEGFKIVPARVEAYAVKLLFEGQLAFIDAVIPGAAAGARRQKEAPVDLLVSSESSTRRYVVRSESMLSRT